MSNTRIKYQLRQATIEVEESRWQCDSCTAPTEHDGARYCMCCRMYWTDVQNGLFNFEDREESWQ